MKIVNRFPFLTSTPREVIAFDRMSVSANLEEVNLIFDALRSINKQHGTTMPLDGFSAINGGWVDEPRIRGGKINARSENNSGAFSGTRVVNLETMSPLADPQDKFPQGDLAVEISRFSHHEYAVMNTRDWGRAATNGELVVAHNYLARGRGLETIPILPEHELIALGNMAIPLTPDAFTEYRHLTA